MNTPGAIGIKPGLERFEPKGGFRIINPKTRRIYDGKAACGKQLGLFNREHQSQKGFVFVGTIGCFLDAYEEETVGDFLFLGGGCVV
jgi:hypothetical protein